MRQIDRLFRTDIIVIRYLFVIFSIMAICNDKAFAQELWGGSSYGMSVEDVKRVIPNTTSVTRDQAISFPDKGETELLRINNIEIVNKPFNVSFLFNRVGLSRVWVTLDSKSSQTSVDLIFEDLKTALRSKYGMEINSSSSSGIVVNMENVKWAAGRTNITLFLISARGKDSVVRVIYGIDLAKDADKL